MGRNTRGVFIYIPFIFFRSEARLELHVLLSPKTEALSAVYLMVDGLPGALYPFLNSSFGNSIDFLLPNAHALFSQIQVASDFSSGLYVVDV